MTKERGKAVKFKVWSGLGMLSLNVSVALTSEQLTFFPVDSVSLVSSPLSVSGEDSIIFGAAIFHMQIALSALSFHLVLT